MLAAKATVAAAALVSAAVLAHGHWTKPDRFHLAVSGDGRTAWRIEPGTGRVSVCGMLLNGPALAMTIHEYDRQLDEVLPTIELEIPSPGGAPRAVVNKVDEAKALKWLQDNSRRSSELHRLTTPICAPWAAPASRAAPSE